MDGKQARKIGASSSLGMVLDHGCDSMNAFIQGITMNRILMFGSFGSSLAVSVPCMMFFLATYEQ